MLIFTLDAPPTLDAKILLIFNTLLLLTALANTEVTLVVDKEVADVFPVIVPGFFIFGAAMDTITCDYLIP